MATVVEPVASEVSSSKWQRRYGRVHSAFKGPAHREHWDRKIEFFLSCIGYCVGFGNVWRHPYIIHENGGSAFLVPYLIVLFVLALPIFYMETLLGQFSGCNPIEAFNFAPAFVGIGIGMMFVVFYVVIYYIAYMVYSTKYFFASFAFELPWAKCLPDWGADKNCRNISTLEDSLKVLKSCVSLEGTNYTLGIDCFDYDWPAVQYWHKSVLRDKDGSIESIGEVHWDLFLILLLSWIIQYFCLIKGIKSSGKIVYFTATFPFLLLLIFLIHSLTLNGAIDGLVYLFRVKDWNTLLQAKVWRAAITQALYSTGIAFGCLILYSSYNDFNYGIERMAFVIVMLDLLASLLSSMTVFSILGFLAKEVKKNIDDVVEQGPALIFITMPQAIAVMPVAHLWSVLYFLLLFSVGIDSQAVMVDTFMTVIYEEIPAFKNHRGRVRLGMFIILFLLSIPITTTGGFYVVNFLEIFSIENTLIFLALCEVIAFVFTYGILNMNRDAMFMTGKSIKLYWKICWTVVVPVFLIILLFLAFSAPNPCENLNLSTGLCVFGWIIEFTCILPVPIAFLIVSIKYKVTKKSWELALKPTLTWGPREPRYKVAYLDFLEDELAQKEIMDESTKDAMRELKSEISTEIPNVSSVVDQRVKEKRLGVFPRIAKIFHPGELEHMERN